MMVVALLVVVVEGRITVNMKPRGCSRHLHGEEVVGLMPIVKTFFPPAVQNNLQISPTGDSPSVYWDRVPQEV